MHQSLVSRSVRRAALFVLILAGACSDGLVEPSPKVAAPTVKPSFTTDSVSCMSGYIIANGVATCVEAK